MSRAARQPAYASISGFDNNLCLRFSV